MKTFEQHKRLSELLILLESTVFEEQRWQKNASQSSSGGDAFVKRRNDIKTEIQKLFDNEN